MNILLVDDEPELINQLRQALESRKYRVETASDGEQALDKILGDTYDLVLLDIMLPRLDGFGVLAKMRNAGIDTPVIMLTARGDVEDRIKGLDNGADDYLAKPFSMAELMARIRAILRRGGQRDAVLKAGTVEIDTMSRKASKDGKQLLLTPKEFSILEFLLYNKGNAVSKSNLAEHVWGDDYDPFSMSNFIDVHIKNLRHKIQSPESDSIIKTIRGIGFIIDEEQ